MPTMWPMAAIRGLYELVRERDAEIAKQNERIYELTARMKQMEAIVARLAAKEVYNENE